MDTDQNVTYIVKCHCFLNSIQKQMKTKNGAVQVVFPKKLEL